MAEINRIVVELHASFEGGAWYGASVLEALDAVDADRAAAYPISGAHSIWEQVNHLLYSQRIMLARLSAYVAWCHDEDWPRPHDTSEAAWQAALADLKQVEAELEQAVGRLPDARLDEALGPGGMSLYRTLAGHVQHNAYHVGQIMLLRKALSLPSGHPGA